MAVNKNGANTESNLYKYRQWLRGVARVEVTKTLTKSANQILPSRQSKAGKQTSPGKKSGTNNCVFIDCESLKVKYLTSNFDQIFCISFKCNVGWPIYTLILQQ